MKKKDITFLLTQDIESPSGIGRYFPLSKNLVKLGYSVNIAATHPNFDNLKNFTFEEEGVSISYVSQMHVRKDKNKTSYFSPIGLLVNSLKTTWELTRYVIKNRTNVVVIGKPHPMNSIAGLLGGRLSGARIVLDCDDYEAASNFFSSFWQRWIVKLFENNMPKLVNHVTTNTYFNQNRMIALGVPEEKIDYVPNGVDLERFKSVDEVTSREIWKRINTEDNDIIAYVGSLNLVNHPVDLLLEAFSVIFQRYNNVKLMIIGGGKDLQELKNLARTLGVADHVVFEGRVDPSLVPNYFEFANVSVDPVYDTPAAKGRCPLKIFESWAMGVPFVTSDVGDREILAGSPPAMLLSKPGDKIDLAEKILTVIKNPDLANELSVAGRKQAQKYSWRNLAKIYSLALSESRDRA